MTGALGSIYVGKQMPQLCVRAVKSLILKVATFITEISTPFVNYRSIMLTQRQGDTRLFKANLIAFGILFFLFRVLYYPVMIYRGY